MPVIIRGPMARPMKVHLLKTNNMERVLKNTLMAIPTSATLLEVISTARGALHGQMGRCIGVSGRATNGMV